MKTHAPDRGRRLFLGTAILLCSLVGLASVAHGQLGENAKPEPKPEPVARLDVDALLRDAQVTPASVAGPVWTVTPQPGARLIQVPIVIEPIEQDAQLDQPPIDLRGGRFVAWYVPRPDGQSNAGSGGGFSEPEYSEPEYGPDGYGQPFEFGQPWQGQPAAQQSAPSQGGPQLPEGAPRMTRRMTVHTDGTISWKLERYIPGGELSNANSLYALRLQPDLLREKAPERPQRSPAGEGGNPLERRRQQAEQERTYRAAYEQFRTLQEQVRKLPDEFTTQLPTRLWAIYEIRDGLRELRFEGPDPLPWQVSADTFRAMRETASSRAGGGPLGFEEYNRIAAMGAVAADSHPLTQQFIARTLAAANLVPSMQPGDALYQLVQTLIANGDDATRRVIIGELVRVPPTDAINRLLSVAAVHMQPEEKLSALRGTFSNLNDAASVQQALQAVNVALGDPEGAPAGAVLHELVLATQRLSAPEAMATLTHGVNFDNLEGDRLRDAARAVAADATRYPLASSWLNQRLLGSANPEVVRTTLDVIASARIMPMPEPTPANREAMEMFRNVARPANDLQPTTQGDVAPGDTSLQLPGLIPIDTPDHALLTLLAADNAELRAAAWKALPNFTATDVRGRTPRGDVRLPRILQAAVTQTPTPATLTEFLVRQPDIQAGTAGLAAAVIVGDAETSARAAKLLYGSGRPVTEAMQQSNPEQRGVFASRMYSAIQGEPAIVAGVLRDPNGQQAARWFGEHVAQGQLPPASAFAQQFREERLLDLAASNDADLAAGAAAALVASVGGDKEMAQTMATRFANHSDRSVRGLRELWGPAKQEIYQRKLATAAGDYRVTLQISQRTATMGQPQNYGDDYYPTEEDYSNYMPDPYGGDGYVPGPDSYSAPQQLPADAGLMGLGSTGLPATSSTTTQPGDQTIELGILELKADGQAIRLANDAVKLSVPQDFLAIRIEQPNQLKNLGQAEVAALPLDTARGALDLFPQDDGSWKGFVPFGQNQVLTMTMAPAKSE